MNAGLIDVQGDDTKLEKLQSSSEDLVAILKKNPSKSTSYALIAFDPKAPENDPVIQEVVAVLQKRWQTYRNTFPGTPITVIRAVILDALSKAAIKDDNIGIAFVSSARNVLRFMEAGNENDIWAELVLSLEQQVNARAEMEWATPDSISVPDMDFVVPDAIEIRSSEVTLDKDDLTAHIAAACGPTDKVGQPTSGNTVWPNSGETWSRQFTPLMVDAIHDVFEQVLEGTKISPVDISAPLKLLANAVATHVDHTLKAVSGATAGLQRRTNLIWWKESLYSPCIQTTYRDMPPFVSAALMAFDLHQQIPSFSPASVAAFLYETVLSLPLIEPQEKKPIRELLEEAQKAGELAPLRDAAARLIPEAEGRGPIIGILGKGIGGSLNDERFRDLVGISAESTLSAPEWATWVFRELQAARASREVNVVKKKGIKT